MKTTAKCQICGCEMRTAYMVKIIDRRTHYSYQCQECNARMLGYGYEAGDDDYYNNLMNAKGILVDGVYKSNVNKSGLITTGFELEVGQGVDEEHFKILQNYGYARTSDCTVKAEYKSPVYRNLNGIAKLLYSVVENGAGSVGNGAGTHINVWAEDLGVYDFDIIREYYESIFKPLYSAIMMDGEHDVLFGRKANTWCNGFSASAHETLINVQENKRSCPRIELRICKYNNNKQFMNCLKFSNEMMKAIKLHFVEKFDALGDNTKIAQKTASKLVRIYCKYRGFSKEKTLHILNEVC